MQSPYARLIDATRDTVQARAGQYKRLVMCIALGFIAVAAAALVLRQWPMLWAWALAPCAVITFFIADARSVQAWRQAVLQAWCAGEVRLDILAPTLRQVPGLPPQTVEGMLACLPQAMLDDAPQAWRGELASLQARLARAAMQRLALRAALWALAVAVPVAACLSGRATWLWAWALLPLPAWGVRAAQAWALGRERTRQMQASAAAGLEWAQACAWAAGLDWQGVGAGQRRAWEGIRPGPPGARALDAGAKR